MRAFCAASKNASPSCRDIVEPVRQQLVELRDRRLLARILLAIEHGAAVIGRLVLPRGQAAVAPARAGSGIRVDLVEIARAPPRSTRRGCTRRARGTRSAARPAGSRCAAAASREKPAPPRCATSRSGSARRPAGPNRRRKMADIAVDARRVGPIRLDRDDVEAVRCDQLLRDRGARPVEFGSAVRRLAEQHDFGVAEPVEKRRRTPHRVPVAAGFRRQPRNSRASSSASCLLLAAPTRRYRRALSTLHVPSAISCLGNSARRSGSGHRGMGDSGPAGRNAASRSRPSVTRLRAVAGAEPRTGRRAEPLLPMP